MGAIYMIACAKSDKVYIGSSVDAPRRWKSHLVMLDAGRHHSTHLQRAFRKYGRGAFAFQIVEEVADNIFLRAREQFWLWRHEGRLYNCSPNAFSPLGAQHSKEFRAKRSRYMKGNTLRRGKKMPSGFRESVSERMKGNNHRQGVPHDNDIKQKISAGLKRAYNDGRRQPVDGAEAAKNLAEWNRKVQSGDVIAPWSKPERNAELIAYHKRTGSLKQTGERFGITPGAVWYVVKRYAPEQLRQWRRKA